MANYKSFPLSMPPGPQTEAASEALHRAKLLREMWVSALSSSLFALMVLLLAYLGFINRTAAIELGITIGIYFVVMGVIFMLKQRGALSKFNAPMLQTVWSSAAVYYAIYQAGLARGAIAPALLMILFLSIFGYTVKSARLQTVLFLLLYAFVLGLAWTFKPETANRQLDIANWVLLAMAMPYLVWMGGYMNKLRDRMRERKAFYQTVWETCADAVIVADEQEKVRYANPAFAKLFGYPIDEVLGIGLEQLQPAMPEEDSPGLLKVMRRDALDGAQTIEALGRHRDGGVLLVEITHNQLLFNRHAMRVAFIRDISERKRAQAQLHHMAHHDPLTGLPNRNLLEQRLMQTIRHAQQHGASVWIIFIDIDHFKVINDTLGHKVGDALLRVLAQKMQSAVRAIDTVARLGGDEFVIMLPEQAGQDLNRGIVERILAAVAEPLTIDGHAISVTCSVGVSTYPNDGLDYDNLVLHADTAMYCAKQQGRNMAQFYAVDKSVVENLSAPSFRKAS